MTYKNSLIIICSIFLFIGCSKEENDNIISYEIILESMLSYSDQNQVLKQFKIFESEDEWNNFIPESERVNPRNAENLRNLDYDFSNHNLIIVIGRFHNYCCTKIHINRVYKKEDKVIVDFEESGPGNVAGAALSQSYLLVKIKKEE